VTGCRSCLVFRASCFVKPYVVELAVLMPGMGIGVTWQYWRLAERLSRVAWLGEGWVSFVFLDAGVRRRVGGAWARLAPYGGFAWFGRSAGFGMSACGTTAYGSYLG